MKRYNVAPFSLNYHLSCVTKINFQKKYLVQHQICRDRLSFIFIRNLVKNCCRKIWLKFRGNITFFLVPSLITNPTLHAKVFKMMW